MVPRSAKHSYTINELVRQRRYSQYLILNSKFPILLFYHKDIKELKAIFIYLYPTIFNIPVTCLANRCNALID